MADPFFGEGWRGRRARIENRIHARMTVRAAAQTRLIAPPDLLLIGSARRGRQLMAGQFAFAGSLIQAPGRNPWTVLPPDPGFAEAVQTFTWVDDLAALADPQAEELARAWTSDWLARFAGGSGAGWTPLATARRILRWIGHAGLLLPPETGPETGPEADQSALEAPLMAALAHQVHFLARRQQALPPGHGRIEGLATLVIAGLALEGLSSYVPAAAQALAEQAGQLVATDGSIASRQPEEAMAIFALLVQAEQSLAEAGQTPQRGHAAAIERMAPMLRGLRHVDGRLARFHGGDVGARGQLDRALAGSGVRRLPGPPPQMGFARLISGRTSVIVDAAPPPLGSATAHASTLALELVSGRRPLIVSCGSGASLGAEWARLGRETAAHSTLCLQDQSSSRFTPGRGGDLLTVVPGPVTVQQAAGPAGQSLIVGHNGYVASHGLTHVRKLNLSANGRALVGEDVLAAMTEPDRQRLNRLQGRKRSGLGFAIRFHLHPDVTVAEEPEEGAVALTLQSGEVWQFRQHGGASLVIEPSVYLDKNRLKPRACKQIVLIGTLIDYAAQISWTLAKSRDMPDAVRDLPELPDPPAT